MMYTASSCVPSNQLLSPSAEIISTISTESTMDAISSPPKTSDMGFPSATERKTSNGATKSDLRVGPDRDRHRKVHLIAAGYEDRRRVLRGVADDGHHDNADEGFRHA